MTRPPEVIAASGEVNDGQQDVSGYTWLGMRAAGWVWNTPNPTNPRGTLRNYASHWSTGPKDAERLYRESDIRKLLAAQTALQHFADEVEASGEPEKHAVCATCNDNGLIGGPSYYNPGEGGVPCPDCDELTLIDTAISHLQQARSALNREQPETATGRGYVQDARAALAKVQS